MPDDAAAARTGLDTTVSHSARIWNYWLGGKDNFEADRAQARNVLEVYPQAAELVIQARQFQARAVAYAAQQGIGQFLDVGCGLPTAPNTHQTAQAITPDARVVYVDNDAQVLTHARNLLAQSTGVLACAGDLAYPAEILYDWRVRRFLDFHQPLCLVLAMTMHFFPPGVTMTMFWKTRGDSQYPWTPQEPPNSFMARDHMRAPVSPS